MIAIEIDYDNVKELEVDDEDEILEGEVNSFVIDPLIMDFNEFHGNISFDFMANGEVHL